jgi:hypothetical protein
MTKLMRRLIGGAFAATLIGWLTITPAAAVTVLSFEGLGDLEPVGGFYHGQQANGGIGSGPGSDFGIIFSTNALALIDADAGGSGNFGGEPSTSTGLFFLRGAAATMNVAAGFDTGFSFYYSAVNVAGVIDVWDGLDGTGNLLASLALPLTPNGGAPDPTGSFSPLLPIGVAFDGIARSVDFGGTVNQIVFDDITLGSVTPGDDTRVPLPGSLILLTGGVLLAALGRQRLGAWERKRTS